MKKYLIRNDGYFYKGNIHTHSTLSDGINDPKTLKDKYKALGYSFLCLTDHDVFVQHQDLDEENFIFINGHESETNNNDPIVKTYHFNFYAPNKDIKLSPVFKLDKVWAESSKKIVTQEMIDNQTDLKYDYDYNSLNEVIALANKHGWLVSYNHPVWSTQNYPDYIHLKGLWGVEVWNSGCVYAGYLDTFQPVVDIHTKGEKVFPLATDDTHGNLEIGGGWVMVKAPSLNYENVFAALKNGEFYSSTGPEFKEISLDDMMLTIKTSEVKGIYVVADRRIAFFKVMEDDNPITEATFRIAWYLKDVLKGNLDKNNTFIRIEIEDLHGKRAWSRCYYPKDLFDE